jgi:hypothetical protein
MVRLSILQSVFCQLQEEAEIHSVHIQEDDEEEEDGANKMKEVRNNCKFGSEEMRTITY